MEKTVVKKIRKAIKKKYPASFIFKVHGSGYQRAGLPDLVGCINGKFVGIEVKDVGKEQNFTKVQKDVRDLIMLAGGIAFMSSSAEHTLKELSRRLK